MVNAAGIIGEDKFLRLFFGAIWDGIWQTGRSILSPQLMKRWVRIMWEISVTVLKNNRQAFRESLVISRSNTKQAITEIRSKGISVSIIHSVNDKFFPIKRVKNNFNDEEGKILDGFYEAGGTHNEILLNDEICELANSILDDLENKAKKEEN